MSVEWREEEVMDDGLWGPNGLAWLVKVGSTNSCIHARKGPTCAENEGEEGGAERERDASVSFVLFCFWFV